MTGGVKPALAAGLAVAGVDVLLPPWLAPLVAGTVVALIAFLFRREFARLDTDRAQDRAEITSIRTTQASHGERIAKLEGAQGKTK